MPGGNKQLPAKKLSGRIILARAIAQLRRRMRILMCPELSVWRRWGVQLAVHPSVRPDFRRMLLREGDRFVFHHAGLRLASPPVPAGGNSERVALGFAVVLVEMFAEPDLFWRHVRPPRGGVVLDIGANVGTTAITLSAAVGGSGAVFAFEPLFHETASLNLASNGITNVTIVPRAVGDFTGVIGMDVSEFGIDSRMVSGPASPSGPDQLCRIPVTTLDDWCDATGLTQVDFVKMDIEGAEELALAGAQRTIARSRPMWSISSYHTDFTGEPQHQKLVDALRARGYKVRDVGQDRIYAW